MGGMRQLAARGESPAAFDRRCGLLGGVVVALTACVIAPAIGQAQAQDIPRTPSGKPDLSGTYNVATLTPFQRPDEFGEKAFLTDEEAAEIEREEFDRHLERNAASNPNREAPPDGGDGSPGAAGNVGGYNTFWIDRGSSRLLVDGQYPTSIIVDPPNGRQPPLTDAGQRRSEARALRRRENSGTAWWMIENGPDAPGPYDDPEIRPLAERCLLGFSSTGGPPMLPALYNNLKRIVQTDDHVMILIEMVHDARIVRMNQAHAPPDIRGWLGDSVGHWEGDTLVIDTTNFNDTPALRQATRDLHVVERLTRLDADTLRYEFTVADPNVWTAPWSGEYVWPTSSDRVYEYACHEANYSFRGILGGARILEQDVRDGKVQGK